MGDREEFLARVQPEFPFERPGGVEPLVETVFASLRQHITDGEWADIKSSMPTFLP